ncbi:MAG: Ig-like domain-containing protein [Thermoplasmatota archaeon]
MLLFAPVLLTHMDSGTAFTRNDPPSATGENLTGLWVYEGVSKMIADLDDHELFTDPENDTLSYLAIVDLSSTTFKDRSEFLVVWSRSTNQLSVIQDQTTNGTGNVSVRLYCTDRSEFNLMTDPYVDFIIEVRNVNDLPAWTGSMPPDLFVMEGSNTTLLDPKIDQLFIDDEGDSLRYMAVADLSSPEYNDSAGFRINWLQAIQMLEVGLNESSDWFGKVPVRIFCTDQMEFVFDRDAFVDIEIEVRNVNDPPRWTGYYPWYKCAEEGQPISMIDPEVDKLFYDPDGDTLDYLPVADLSFPEYNESAEFRVRWDRPSRSIEVKLNESSDWFGAVPVRLYCTDQGGFNFNRDPFVDLHITVANVNDPPVWKDIPTLRVIEDTEMENILDLSKYVTDIDNDLDDLDFMIERNNSQRNFSLWIIRGDNDQNLLSFRPLTENWYGSATINITVDDGRITVPTSFQLVVEPVNDLPSIRITSPKEGEVLDEDVFSVIGEAFDNEGIDHVEVLFQGEWVTAAGKEKWGVTFWAPMITEVMKDVLIIARVWDTGGRLEYAYVNVTLKPYVPPPVDTDGDGVPDDEDDLPDDPAASVDTDGDGYPDRWNSGMGPDNSTTGLVLDKFPNDPFEWIDTDGDGFGDNGDAFPQDALEWSDTDVDGVGDNSDVFPKDPGESSDTDGDGFGDNEDAFPDDPAASVDKDGDGYPDRWNTGMSEKDSTTGLKLDHHPDDPMKWKKEDIIERTSTPVLIMFILGPPILFVLVVAVLLYLLRSSKGDEIVPIPGNEGELTGPEE